MLNERAKVLVMNIVEVGQINFLLIARKVNTLGFLGQIVSHNKQRNRLWLCSKNTCYMKICNGLEFTNRAPFASPI